VYEGETKRERERKVREWERERECVRNHNLS